MNKNISNNTNQNISANMNQNISNNVNQQISKNMNQNTSNNMTQNIIDNTNQNISDNMNQNTSKNINQNIISNMNSKTIQKNLLSNKENTQEIIGNGILNEENKRFNEDEKYNTLEECCMEKENLFQRNNSFYEEIFNYKYQEINIISFSIISPTKEANETNQENKNPQINFKEYKLNNESLTKDNSNKNTDDTIKNSDNIIDYEDCEDSEDSNYFMNKKIKRDIPNEEEVYNEVFCQKRELSDESSDNEESLLFCNTRNNIQEIHINIPDKIIVEPFYFDYYKDNYHLFQNYNFSEPNFMSLEIIMFNHKPMFNNLCKKPYKIFENINEIKYIAKKGKFTKKLSNFLNRKKNNENIEKNVENEKLDESLQKIYNDIFEKNIIYRPDDMSRRIKVFVLKKIINYFNSIENRKNEIQILDYQLINEQLNRNFNLIYFDQHLYSILSNKSNKEKEIKNYEIIKKIIDSYNDKKEKSDDIEFLCLKFIDCFDIFRYNKKYRNINFDEEIEKFLFKTYNELKVNLDIEEKKNEDFIKKDYILYLVVLIYNLEKYFCNKQPRSFRNKKK